MITSIFIQCFFGVILKSELLSVGKRGLRVGREQWTDLQCGSADEGQATVFKKVLGFLKDCDKIKLEGVVTTENFDWISCVFWWGQGTDWTCLSHSAPEETSVTRAVESDRQKEMSYREIAGETAVLKLHWLGAVWADWVWGGREVPIEN